MSRARLARFVVRLALFITMLTAGWQLRVHVSQTFTFVGGDGYFYMGAAEELHESGRYAMRLPLWIPQRDVPPPLTYCRVPGPSLVMALFAPPLPVQSYDPWHDRMKRLHRVIDLGTCCLVFAFGLAIFGWGAAWVGFALALAHPVLVMFAASLLSETLATMLTTTTLLLCTAAVTWRVSVRGFFMLLGASAACAGLATLVRVDSGVLIVPIFIAPLLRAESWRALWSRRSLQTAAVQILGAAGIFVLVLSPWLWRNNHQFGRPYLSGALCDTHGQPVKRAAFARWMSTWLSREEQLPMTMWCFLRPSCQLSIQGFPSEAFGSDRERQAVEYLLNLRAKEGTTDRVDEGFAALAGYRTKLQPFRTLVTLPLTRAKHLWWNRNDLALRSTSPATWPRFITRVEPKLLQIAVTIDVLALLGLVFCFALPAFARTRRAAFLIALTVLVRTAALAYTGSTEGRYLLEIVPALLVLCGATLSAPFRRADRLR